METHILSGKMPSGVDVNYFVLCFIKRGTQVGEFLTPEGKETDDSFQRIFGDW